MEVALVLVASVLLQFTAAFFALRLIQVTRKHVSWALIVVAIFLMGARRCITLSRLLSGDLVHQLDVFYLNCSRLVN